MAEFSIQTERKKQIVDITDEVSRHVSEAREARLCQLFVLHTTAALTTADLDPGTDLDMLDAFDKIVPELNYRHPHNPAHVGDHIMSSIIGPDVAVPIVERKLHLGTWQRIVLVELDGPRKRSLLLQLL